jgi:tetratricopeptide (TPR) repeat protein
LKVEIPLKLREEETKLERMGIPIDFEALGFRVLRFAAITNPTGSWESRITQLERRAAELLGSRHRKLSYVLRCSEKMHALLAINTAPAWVELASLFRKELEKPDWALEAASVALSKDSRNVAAHTVEIAANGDLGRFGEAHASHVRALALDPKDNYVAAAVAKVEFLERRLDYAIKHALEAFTAKPNAPAARLIANIYREAGLRKEASKWYTEAEYIDGPEPEEITQAHVAGLLKLARETLGKSNTSF